MYLCDFWTYTCISILYMCKYVYIWLKKTLSEMACGWLVFWWTTPLIIERCSGPDNYDDTRVAERAVCTHHAHRRTSTSWEKSRIRRSHLWQLNYCTHLSASHMEQVPSPETKFLSVLLIRRKNGVPGWLWETLLCSVFHSVSDVLIEMY